MFNILLLQAMETTTNQKDKKMKNLIVAIQRDLQSAIICQAGKMRVINHHQRTKKLLHVSGRDKQHKSSLPINKNWDFATFPRWLLETINFLWLNNLLFFLRFKTLRDRSFCSSSHVRRNDMNSENINSHLSHSNIPHVATLFQSSHHCYYDCWWWW